MTDDIFDTRFEDKDIEIDDNKVSLGDDINITEKDPGLMNVVIGVGWDANAFDADAVDLDISLFMLNTSEMTRVDEDFIFYNNMEGGEGSVEHQGDSRTGAGDGDDENIFINLQALSFDISRLVFSLSIYRGEEKDQNLDMVRGAYIRVVNAATHHEILRYEIDPEVLKDHQETAMVIAHINREGPKWHFVPQAEFVDGGLAAVATRYGLEIIKQ